MGLAGNKGRQPQRTCIICRKKRAKAELLRLALDDEDRVHFDHRQDCRGRGSYVCPRAECLTRVKLMHLNRAFRRTLTEDAWNPAMAMAEALKGCDASLIKSSNMLK